MSKKSILHVEDNDAEALMVQTALEEIASPVSCNRVSDVDRALKVLETTAQAEDAAVSSLVLLDLDLPPRSGYELLTEIRERKALDKVRVVIFSSSASPADRRRSLSLGAFAHVCKPSTFTEYIAALQEVLAIACNDSFRIDAH